MIRSNAFSDVDPMHGLMLAIIQRAKLDAKKGDLGALAFLVADGLDYVERFNLGCEGEILNFCNEIASEIDAGKLTGKWGG